MKKKKTKEEITIKPNYKHRVPHKPTKVHRNKKKYTRKGKAKDKRQEEVLSDIEEAVPIHLCNQFFSVAVIICEAGGFNEK